MVAKLFSSIAKQRMKIGKNRVDWMACKSGLGPKLFASSKDGLLMEWLDADGLNETIVHSTSDWVEAVASQLAKFHAMETPPRPPNMLWETLNTMMDMTTQDDCFVRDEVFRQQRLLEPLNLPVVLGHGDFKPSNIIGDRFIDFETSGMHYRGFDLAKLFRTDNPTKLSSDNMNTFLEYYTLSSSLPAEDIKKELHWLKLETELMEPLTWLEAGVFFLCSASVDAERADKWNQLARERLESYGMSIVGFDGHVAEYRKRQ